MQARIERGGRALLRNVSNFIQTGRDRRALRDEHTGESFGKFLPRRAVRLARVDSFFFPTG